MDSMKKYTSIDRYHKHAGEIISSYILPEGTVSWVPMHVKKKTLSNPKKINLAIIKVNRTVIKVLVKYILVSCSKKEKRRQQDSNLRRQSPTDFESVSLTTRTYRQLVVVYHFISLITMYYSVVP